ncbi:MAG: hypothetical protein ACLQUY_17805 [Ktedonobacterales bacterium]
MIRPVPYVNLPGIYYAIDRHAQARHSEFAHFVVAPTSPAQQSSVPALFRALFSVPSAFTWVCEDRWQILGLAQAHARPGGEAWDLSYLAALTNSGGHSPTPSSSEVLMELTQYALNVAIMRGVHRFFARVEDEMPEIELFSKLGFQRYARDLTYWLSTPQGGLDALASQASSRRQLLITADECDSLVGDSAATERQDLIQPEAPSDGIVPDVPLRPWHRHDVWGLLRLYDASTPRRVQMAESLTSNELLYTLAGSARSWSLPLVEPAITAFVHDRGVRLGGWIRLRLGRGSQPHQLWIMAHPDEPDTSLALVRFGLRVLAKEGPRPVACQVREYDGTVANTLRAAGFLHSSTHALLVRHLTMRALRKREVLAVEPRVVYGVEGLRNTPTHLSEGEITHYATRDLR